MARSLKEIQDDLQNLDENYPYAEQFSMKVYAETRRQLVEELEAWHQLPVEDRN